MHNHDLCPTLKFKLTPIFNVARHGIQGCILLCLQPEREESAGYVWDLIQHCLEILGISESEALCLWSMLAAIYHLGFARVKKGEQNHKHAHKICSHFHKIILLPQALWKEQTVL